MRRVTKKRLRIFIFLGGLLCMVFLMYVIPRATLKLSDRIFTVDTELVEQVRGGSDIRSLNINVKTFNEVWQVVNTSVEMYLYSAYYDDRPSLLSSPVIRVIAVSEATVEQRKVYCYVWFDVSTDPFIAVAEILKSGAGNYRHGKYFREHIYTCKLQTAKQIPKAISIELEIHDRKPPKPSTYMTVEVPEKPETKQDFINCVKVTYWKADPYRVVEWMELHKIWGVNKVTIYNGSIHDESAKVFLHYQKEGFVDFRQVPQFLPDPGKMSILLTMSAVICDCLYRNMYKYKKVVVTDLDEMIVPRTTLNYNSMLEEVNRHQPSGHKALSYIFRNGYFFLDPQMPEDKEISDKLVTIRHRTRLPPSSPRYSVKSIIDPQACVVMHNHFCWIRTAGYDTNGHTVDVNVDLAMNQHYKKCHFDEYLGKPGECAEMMKEQIKDDSMLRFKDTLIENVSKQLKSLGLDPLS